MIIILKTESLELILKWLFGHYLVVTCVPLSIPPKAVLLNTSCGNTYGSNCAYGCHSGYGSTNGNVARTCLDTGQWSGNPINCTGSSIINVTVCR